MSRIYRTLILNCIFALLLNVNCLQYTLAQNDSIAIDSVLHKENIHKNFPFTINFEPDTFPLNDYIQNILESLNESMTDSLSEIVVKNDRPYIPIRDGFIVPNVYHFVNYNSLYNFSYVYSRLNYAEKLRFAYESLVKTDASLNFNLFRYMPDKTGLVLNYYKFKYLTYKDYNAPDLVPKDTLFSDYFGNDADLLSYAKKSNASMEYQVWNRIRNRISFNSPDKIDLHWNKLPDPPIISDTIFLPIIKRDQIDLESLSERQRDYARKITEFNSEKSPWELVGYTALHANETFVKNWARGGESSISILGIGRFDANYNAQGLKWENNAELKLGALRQFGDLDQLVKNDDLLKLSSKLGYRAFKNWFYTVNFDFQTQLFYGYDFQKGNLETPISGFLSPAKTYLSLGMDFKYRKNLLSVLVSPLTMKHTLVADTSTINEGRYGIEEGKIAKVEAGAYLKSTLKWEINTFMRVESKLYLFSNYVKNPQNIDVDWEGEFEYRLSHVFSLRMALNLKYDDDEKILVGTNSDGEKIYSKRLQVKQLMSVGVSYRF